MPLSQRIPEFQQLAAQPVRGVVSVMKMNLHLAVSFGTDICKLIQAVFVVFFLWIEEGVTRTFSIGIAQATRHSRIFASPAPDYSPRIFCRRTTPERLKMIDKTEHQMAGLRP
jgi:hypothetical protein